MYAVIETGGKQYRVQEGDVITVEKLKTAAGETVAFDKVLLLSDENGAQVGTPYLEAAKVFGNVVENGKGQKVIIFKYKAKKDYRKKQGHRQPYTKVEICGISADGTAPVRKEVPAAAEPQVTQQAEEPVAAEAAAEKKTPALRTMKKDELIAFAKENNIAIDEKATKPVIIDTIEAAMK